MTDQIFYEELRATIRDAITSYLDMYADEELRELATESANPPAPALPTLADMSVEDRAACKWMQADTETWGSVIIIGPDLRGRFASILDQRGEVAYEDHEQVTPRPDLPPLEWPGTGQ